MSALNITLRSNFYKQCHIIFDEHQNNFRQMSEPFKLLLYNLQSFIVQLCITISYLTSKDVATIQDEAIKEAQVTVKLSTCVSATRITGYVESSVIDVT